MRSDMALPWQCRWRKTWPGVFVNQRRENEVTMKAEKVKHVPASGSSSFKVCADCGASYAAAFAWCAQLQMRVAERPQHMATLVYR